MYSVEGWDGGEANGRGIGVCSACQHLPFNLSLSLFLLESLTPLTKINSEMCTFGTLKLVWLRYDYYLPTFSYH